MLVIICIYYTFYAIGLAEGVPNLLMLIGAWMIFAAAKKQKFNAGAVLLVRISYLVAFILCTLFSLFTFANELLCIDTTMLFGERGVFLFEVAIFLLTLGVVVFRCVSFASVYKMLGIVRKAHYGISVTGCKSSSFAPVSLFILGGLELLLTVVATLFINSSAFNNVEQGIMTLLFGGRAIDVAAAVFSCFVKAIGGLLLMKWNKLLQEGSVA
jgi:hypothetical protein